MQGIVLYDDICNFCTGLVLFIKKRDKSNRFHFMSLQSEEGRGVLLAAGLPGTETGTAVYMSEGQYYLRSSAVLHILKDIDGAWKILFAFIIIPTFIRDFIYRLIANNRYRIFGKRDSFQI